MPRPGLKFSAVLFLALAATLAPAAPPALAGPCDELARKSVAVFEMDPVGAVDGLTRAFRDCPENDAIAYNLAIALYRTNEKKRAFELFRGLSEKNGSPRALANAGWVALALDDSAGASEFAEKCLDASPDDAGCLSLRLSALVARQDFGPAMEMMDKNASVLPAACRARTLKEALAHARALYEAGDQEEAADFLTGLSAIAPGLSALEEARDLMVAALLDGTEPESPPRASGRALLSRGSGTSLFTEESPPGPLCSVNSYALLIGISQYRLRKAMGSSADDARSLATLITGFCDFAGGLRHVRVRTDREADSATLKADLDWLVEQAKNNPKARILFYFAGISAPGEKEGDILLACFDAPENPPFSGSGLSLSELVNRFSGLPNEDFTAIMDTCRPPEGEKRPPCHGAAAPPLASAKNILFSAGNDCTGQGNRKSAFSHFLFKALSGAADLDHDGWVDTSEAFLYVNEMISDKGLCMKTYYTGDLPLRLARISTHDQ